MKARILTLIIVALAARPLSANAQPAIQWEATHPVNVRSFGWSAIEVEGAGQPGYVICGEQAPVSGVPDYDGVLWKVDPGGVYLSNLVITSNNLIDETFHSVVEDVNHNLVAGGTTGFGSIGADMWLVKVDPTGMTSFNNHYGNAVAADECWSVQETSDGGYILGGYTSGYGSGKDFYLVKTDVNGALQWDAHWNNAGSDVCYSVLEIAPDEFILAGTTQGGGAGGVYRGYLARYDYPGGLVWQKTYHHPALPGQVMVYSVDQAPGGYILGGETNCVPPGDYDGLLIKTDYLGNRLWGKVYVDCPAEGFRCVKYSPFIPDSGYIAAGHVTVAAVPAYSAGLAVRTDLAGNQMWFDYYSYAPPLPQLSNSVAVTSDAGAILGGTRRLATGSQNDRMHLIKLAPALDCAQQRGEEGQGTVQASEDFFSMAAPEPDASNSSEAVTMQIGPNPFNPTTNISFQLAQTGIVQLSVYDVSGRQIAQLVNGTREAGSHQVTFDASTLPSGMYFAKLVTAASRQTQKLLLVK